MTERELLELAAKAAGIEIHSFTGDTIWQPNGIPWNPRDDDADSFRLMTKLLLQVSVLERCVEVVWTDFELSENHRVTEYYDYPEEVNAAARLAVLRCAAEIGKGMKP